MKLFSRKRSLFPPPVFLLLFLLVASVVLAGCGQTARPGGQKPPVGQSPAGQNTAQQQPLALPVYYLKSADGEEYLVREIHYVSNTGDPVTAALEKLIAGRPVTPGAARVLPPDTKILGVKISNGLATVNFSPEVLKANVGAEGEALGIQSIVDTLTEFPEIKAVSFEVNGKVDQRTKDWWGHVGLYEQPFHRDVSRVYEPAIWVTHPTTNQIAGVPLLIKGSARVFEGAVTARLLDDQGRELARGTATASSAAPGRGDFEIQLKFTPPPSGKGTLEVFSLSPRDGSEQNKVTIPVRWP
ncbi:Gmad2 immunoglobulin-like domain-containing protein [Desulfotomaculum copahuensis]|uniref:Spore gernimation protein n=1 Tax=Desulfotomaculum copahuensis TaxID=1838280 RepID=A0A1B7LJG5_9FIRM|nr:Gmad2 immunoglobulin-like domain-containing protein [Desulfotomaculum copahuensis]OAT86709.1 spore gernimation protein [Desulfotomaculum copahuensis]